MLVSLTVGKVDAGVAVLLTEDKRLIEFPSILLPPNINSGSIVDITVSRNFSSEAKSQSTFTSLQNEIYTTFGQRSPSAPVLRLRNATQTSVVLEWDPIELATAEMRSLSLYRNGSKAGHIPRPTETSSTKISGLAVDTEFTFHLVLRTSAGTYSSKKLAVRTHKMTDLSGITVTPGVLPGHLKESLKKNVQRIGAKISETVRIDTTHFVCVEGRGQQWEKAVEMNIPVVEPGWVDDCERQGRIVGVRGYYLNADPRMRQMGGPNPTSQQDLHRQQSPDTRPSESVSPDRYAPVRSPDEVARGDAPNGTGSANTTSSDAADDEEGPPPSPPPKDELDEEGDAAEPKTMRDEPKTRVEDRDQYEKFPGYSSDHDQESMDERKAKAKQQMAEEERGKGTGDGEGEGFSDVAL
ncbi:MAG: Chitin synthase, class 5 [Piccolia ochrophora]|nr:MAG: Chitin synthase, class 5 [Piccolia ochrophora]